MTSNFIFKIKSNDLFSREEAKFQQDEEAIRAEDLKIQEKLIMYWKILRENERKIKRASERFDAEEKRC